MSEQYDPTEEEIDRMYDYLFTQRNQFVHRTNPVKKPKLDYITPELESRNDYFGSTALWYRVELMHKTSLEYDRIIQEKLDEKLKGRNNGN